MEQELDINSLELLTVIVALKLWGNFLRGLKLQIWCDNIVSVTVVNSGRSRHEFLNSCLREISFLCARYQLEVRCVHIRGVDNRASDRLSRWHLDTSYQRQFFAYAAEFMTENRVTDGMFRFTHDW